MWLAKTVGWGFVDFTALIALRCAFGHAFIDANPNPRISIAFAIAFAGGLAFFAADVVCSSHQSTSKSNLFADMLLLFQEFYMPL